MPAHSCAFRRRSTGLNTAYLPQRTAVASQGLTWVMDDSFLRESGPRAEGILPSAEVSSLHLPDEKASTAPTTRALYVSPTEGQLSPGEEARVRLTFTPKRAGSLSFSLPVWLTSRVPPPGSRPYMTLHVRVSGGEACVRTCAHFFSSPKAVVESLTSTMSYLRVKARGERFDEAGYRMPKVRSFEK